MKKNIFYIILAAFIIITIIGIYSINKNKNQGKTVRIGYLSDIGSADHFIAKNQNLYEKAGFKIKESVFNSSNQLYDAVARGDIDIVPDLSSVPILINQIKDPGKVKIFRTDLQYVDKPFDQIIVMPSSPIQFLNDLADKKIGVFPGSTATAFIKDYLYAKNSVDISKIEFIQIPPQEQLQALEAGSIDALYAYEPNATYALVKMEARVTGTPIQSWSKEGNPVTVGIVSSDFSQANPDLAEKIIKIYDQTNNFLKNNDTETRQILIKELKLDPEVAQKVNLNYHSNSDEINKEAYQKLIDQLISIGVLDSQPDMSTIFYR